MNLTRKNASYIKDGINVYNGDISDKEKIKISDRYIVIGNLITPDIISMKDLIVIGNIIADTVFIKGDLICIGSINIKEEIILGEKRQIPYNIFNKEKGIVNNVKTKKNCKRENIGDLNNTSVKLYKEIYPNVDTRLTDKNKINIEGKSELISNDIKNEIKSLNLINNENKKEYLNHSSIFIKLENVHKLEIEKNKNIQFFKFKQCLYFRVSQICEFLNTYKSKIESEILNILHIGYIGENKNGINFCRIDDVYRILTKLLSISEPDAELNEIIKYRITLLFNKIKALQKDINLFDNTIPYWTEKINALLDIYEKKQLKGLIDLNDEDLENLNLGYNIKKQKRDKLDELYNIKIKGDNSVIQNKMLKMIQKRGSIISGKITSIEENRVFIKNNLNVNAYLQVNSGSYKNFFIGNTIYAYIDDVVSIGNEVTLILKNNDKYFIFKCIENLLEELNYRDVFWVSIDKKDELFTAYIRSKNLFDTDIILLNEQINSIIKGVKVILKLQ